MRSANRRKEFLKASKTFISGFSCACASIPSAVSGDHNLKRCLIYSDLIRYQKVYTLTGIVKNMRRRVEAIGFRRLQKVLGETIFWTPYSQPGR